MLFAERQIGCTNWTIEKVGKSLIRKTTAVRSLPQSWITTLLNEPFEASQLPLQCRFME